MKDDYVMMIIIIDNSDCILGAQQESPGPSKNKSNLVRRAQLSFKTFRKPKDSAGEQLTLSDEVKSETNV